MTVVIDKVSGATAAGTTAEGLQPHTGPESAIQHARQKGDAKGSLYKPRTPIYPKLVHGQ